VTKFVFFSADRSAIELTVDDITVGRAYNAAELLKLMEDNGITTMEDFYLSGSIDFSEEEGFPPGGAKLIIETALVANLPVASA